MSDLTKEQIVALLSGRRADRSPLMERARLISQHYNGRVAVPLPEIDDKEAPAVANLIGQGIDQHSMRIASTMPDINCPPAKPGVKISEDKAITRRKIANAWMENNSMDLVNAKRARHLVAYANSPVLLRPDEKTKTVKWEAKSPLDTYPAPVLDELDYCPPDVIFTYTRSWKWLRTKYPAAAAQVTTNLRTGDQVTDDAKVELVEYRDDTSVVLVATGTIDRGQLYREADYGIDGRSISWLSGDAKASTYLIELGRTVNLAGICPVVMPQRVSLDLAKGFFDDTVGIYQMQAKMMALEVNAVTRAIFPDTWYIKDPNGGGVIRAADGLRGVMGELDGGKLQEIQMQPGFQTTNTINMLERSMRLNSAMPAEYGAESPTNVRTDLRGRSVFSAGVDFYIAEAQKIMGRSLKDELQIAAQIETVYYNVRKSFYVTWGKNPGLVDYTPSDIFGESKVMLPDYAFGGMDLNALSVALGQGVAGGYMSLETARRHHPLVADPQREKHLITGEGLERALLAGIEQQAAQGQIPPGDVARMMALALVGKQTLPEIVAQVQQEAQARQAQQAPPGAPETQPGIAQPGQGAEQPSIAPPPQSLANLHSVLNDLRSGQSFGQPGNSQGALSAANG